MFKFLFLSFFCVSVWAESEELKKFIVSENSLEMDKAPNEDRIRHISLANDFVLSGVFDGHNGHEVAELANTELMNRLRDRLNEHYARKPHPKHDAKFAAKLAEMEKKIRFDPSHELSLSKLMMEEILKFDYELVTEEKHKNLKNSGSTYIILLSTDKEAIVLNGGNSRLLVLSEDFVTRRVTTDHNTDNTVEVARLQSEGHSLKPDPKHPTLKRLNYLHPTRTLGDRSCVEHGKTAIPDIFLIPFETSVPKIIGHLINSTPEKFWPLNPAKLGSLILLTDGVVEQFPRTTDLGTFISLYSEPENLKNVATECLAELKKIAEKGKSADANKDNKSDNASMLIVSPRSFKTFLEEDAAGGSD